MLQMVIHVNVQAECVLLSATICTHRCLYNREHCHFWKVSRALTPHAPPKAYEQP